MQQGRCIIGKPKSPQPTDPKLTSAAQTGTNVSTSIANAFLQNMNEVTPDGTKTFSQTGDFTWTDPYTEKTYTVPRFSVTQTLSPTGQRIKGQQDKADLNLATLGADLSGTLGQQLTGNFQLGNEAVEGRLDELMRMRADPRFAREEEALRTRLANQGVTAGSEAWNREMEMFGQNKNDAYNQMYLQGRGQAAQEMLTEDNQRINQISALLSGGQVSMPNFMTGANVGGMATTDNAGLITNYDNQRMQAWQQDMANRQSLMGGLFSLGAGGLAGGYF